MNSSVGNATTVQSHTYEKMYYNYVLSLGVIVRYKYSLGPGLDSTSAIISNISFTRADHSLSE